MIVQDLATVAEVCRNRATTYSFLSRMFERELTRELIAEIRSQGSPIRSFSATSDLFNDRMKDGLDRINRYLASIETRELEEVTTELAAEYAGLFLGVRGTPMHPSESLYLGREKLILQ